MSVRWMRATGQLLLVVSLVFWSLPALDIWASKLVFDQDRHAFAGVGVEGLQRLRDVLTFLVALTLVVAVGGLVGRTVPRLTIAWPDSRACLFVIVAALLGPVLLVNVALKDQWGRPRPYQTTDFGGDRAFRAVWERGGECPRNCSFVSGEVAASWWLMAPAFCLVGRRYRRYAYGAVVLLTLAVGTGRFVVGSHFLSDVILAVLLTHLVTSGCRWYFYSLDPPWSRSARIDAGLARLGGRLRQQCRALAVRLEPGSMTLGVAAVELGKETAALLKRTCRQRRRIGHRL